MVKSNFILLAIKTLILDLDETLIHCNTNPGMKSEVTLPITFPGGEKIRAPINIRPYAREFLAEMAQHYEIIVFTASHGCYANVVLDHLDPGKKYISHRFFRESCVQNSTGVYIKDLRVIDGRNLDKMILVDNATYSFVYQLENGIPIIPFYDSKEDKELLKLAKYLKQLEKAPDVRLVNKHHFKFHSLRNISSIEESYKFLKSD